MPTIGISFSKELAAAGLMGKPFSWRPSGELSFSPEMSQADKDAVLVVLAAHDPTPILFQGEQVYDASTVDAMTVKRIAAVAGDVNSQLKALRLATWANYVKGNGNAFGQADKDKADAIISASLERNAQVEAIRAEGVTFKQSKGWA